MGKKIEIPIKERNRITVPEDLRKHLKLKDGDNIWYERLNNGKAIIGRIEVSKKYVD